MLCLVVTCLILSTTMGEMLNTKNCGLNEILERKINRTSYIVGGRTAGAGVWPWACSVGFTKQNMWEHYCGGTLGGFLDQTVIYVHFDIKCNLNFIKLFQSVT